MDATLKLRGIRRAYKDVVAVANLDLDLVPGQVYGLLGPNGSGKSTTLRVSLGLATPDAGTVALFGASPGVSQRRRVGLVPEQRSLTDSDRLEEVLLLLLRLRGFSRRDARSRAHHWIERMELGALADRRISQLSKGQQQKAQVALAVAHDPDLLILDEPFSGLDPHHQRLIATVFREAADRGATVILSTHRLREAEALVDQVVMMSRGRKVLEGPLQELRMAHQSTRYRLVVRGDASWIQGDEVLDWTPSAEGHLVTLRDGANSHALLGRAIAHEASIVHFEQILPSLPELFEAHTVTTASRGEPA